MPSIRRFLIGERTFYREVIGVVAPIIVQAAIASFARPSGQPDGGSGGHPRNERCGYRKHPHVCVLPVYLRRNFVKKGIWIQNIVRDKQGSST